MPKFAAPIALKAFEALWEKTKFEIAFKGAHWKTSRSDCAGASPGWTASGRSVERAERCDDSGECSFDSCEWDVVMEFGGESVWVREERNRDVVGCRNGIFIFGIAGRGEANRSGENVVDGAEDGGSDNAASACST